MCKPSDGYRICEEKARCWVCEADGAVTPLRDLKGEKLEGNRVCEICDSTCGYHPAAEPEENFPVLTYRVMVAHVNQALNIAVEQISARLIEYGDASWTGH